MTIIGWLQISLLFLAVVIVVKPLGLYLARVFSGEGNVFSPIFAPVERGLYAAAGVDPAREQGWLAYTLSMLAFSLAGFLSLYAILRLQAFLPLNPQGFGNVPPDLAFNTAVSFITNTNWQNYAGETTLSHFSQMVGLTLQNFVSAASGIAIALAVTRAFACSAVPTIGNFWVDLTRATLYVLLPIAALVAVAFVAMGLPQTFNASVEATTLEGAKQTIALGPVASQEAIKQLGTNGGGFFNANAAHPFENPTALSNYLNIFAMLSLSTALLYAFGQLVGNRRQGWAFIAVTAAFLIAGVAVVYWAEAAGNPILSALGLDPALGNMEGKEVRFGQAMTALYATVTTGLSDGGVNGMHGSFTGLGGLVPMFLIQLGEVLPGGVGSGLYGMIVFGVLAVFVAGLMVGRTPELLGKKIESREMKYAMFAVLILPVAILGFTAISAVLPSAVASIGTAGPHGLSEILYAYTSAAGNNGSAFGGLTGNTLWYNTTLGFAMLLGRFAYAVPVLAIAGSIAAKTRVPASKGTFPTDTPLFGLLIGIILILGGLQLLAEASLFSGHFHCDAIAIVATEVMAVAVAEVGRLLNQDHVFALEWTKHLSRELQSARKRAEIISLRTVGARVDAWLTWNDGDLPPKGEWRRLAEESPCRRKRYTGRFPDAAVFVDNLTRKVH